MKNYEIITFQQETGLSEYKKHINYMESISLPFLDFWEWYSFWCIENSLYNDRASYQNEGEIQ